MKRKRKVIDPVQERAVVIERIATTEQDNPEWPFTMYQLEDVGLGRRFVLQLKFRRYAIRQDYVIPSARALIKDVEGWLEIARKAVQ